MPDSCRHRHDQAHNQGSAHEKQRRPEVASYHGAHRLVAFQGIAHISVKQLPQPYKVLDIERLIQSQGDPFCLYAASEILGP